MRKTEWHLWTLDQYSEEEQWLNKKAQEGWALTEAFAVRYVFEPCQPGEYVYKIVFTDGVRGTTERDNFTSFLEENGIEEVGRYHRWAYYRKKNDGTGFEIFNTVREELAHINKIRKLSSVLLMIMIICLSMELRVMMVAPSVTVPMVMTAAVSVMILKIYRGLSQKAKKLEADMALFE
ncbi:MAG: DUF2812 domain-containing protein [Oscillospiraceae bacterium]|nr:DUF2812 domain-containing protein [Oscillospiraceae bacterium]